MKKRKVVRSKVRCYACMRPIWVSDTEEPDKVLVKHRTQRCKVTPLEQWEKDRRKLYFGDEKEPEQKPKGKKSSKDRRRKEEG